MCPSEYLSRVKKGLGITMLQYLCEKITAHRFNRLEGWTDHAEPTEYYYCCRVCRLLFWNTIKPKEKQKGNKIKGFK